MVALRIPDSEINEGEELFVPSNKGTALDSRLAQDVAPAQFDGVKIEDMNEAEFAAARFAPNKLAQMDAINKYHRGFAGKYKTVMRQLSGNRK